MQDQDVWCVTFIPWRFSRADAASWVSNARRKILLSDLPFEGYIQSDDEAQRTNNLVLPMMHLSIAAGTPDTCTCRYAGSSSAHTL